MQNSSYVEITYVVFSLGAVREYALRTTTSLVVAVIGLLSKLKIRKTRIARVQCSSELEVYVDMIITILMKLMSDHVISNSRKKLLQLCQHIFLGYRALRIC